MSTDTGLSVERLRRLLEAGQSLTAELDLGLVLDRLLHIARELTGARYAALGVLDERRHELAQFHTKGIDEDTHRAIGELPHGRGVLGLLIDDPRPLRLHDVTTHPRSYGFPPEHPPMRTFLGVPVLVRGEAWGNLYLTEKEGGEDFDQTDEETAVVLANWAGIAIDNARLYHAVESRRSELERAVRGFEATAAVVRAVGAETNLDRVLELVVKRGRALVEAHSVLILLAGDGGLRVAAAAGEASPPHDVVLPVEGSTAGAVLRRRQPRRLAAEELEVAAERLGVPGSRQALLVPLLYRDRGLGVLAAFDRLDGGPFGTDDEEVLVAFAASAATAVATARSVESERLRHSLRAAEAERRRWARELHDETLQALGALRLLLSGAARSEDPERLRAALRQASDQVTHDIDNLRAIIADLRPAALDELGLEPALNGLVHRTAAAQGLEVRPEIALGEHRLSPELETIVYRLVQEAVTNVVKHSRASGVAVQVREDGDAVEVRVADDGVGFDPDEPAEGYGLAGMRERVALAGGSLRIDGRAPGTVVQARIPLSSPAATRTR